MTAFLLIFGGNIMKLDRLLEITFILNDRRTTTAAELADRFGVSVRTIYRDIDILSACGIPVYTEKGHGGGIFLMEQYSLNNALLTDEEQGEILMALQSLTATKHENASSVVSKLRGIFGKNFDNWIEIDFSSWGNSENEKKLFALIRDGILHSTAISFRYHNSNGETSERTVEPHKLIFKGQSWYLFAWCRAKKDFRYFKLSRIEQASASEINFIKKPADSFPDEHYGTNISMITLRLKIHSSMVYRIRDEIPDCSYEKAGEFLIATLSVPEKSPWLIGWLLSYGAALTVLEPPEIKEKYLSAVRSIEDNYNMTY